MAHDVFICHSSKDKIAADTACAVLERAGIRCWVAPRDVPAGQSWAASIIRAINDTKVMLLLFSGHTNQSPQIEREVERAVHRHIPVVTFRLEDVLPTEALEYFISSDHWLDAFTPPVNRHYEALARRITDLLNDGAGQAGSATPGVTARTVAQTSPSRLGVRPIVLALLGAAALAAVLVVAVVAKGPQTPSPAQFTGRMIGPQSSPSTEQTAPATADAAPQAAASLSEPQGADAVCTVADPTPTPLNVREEPDGRIVSTLANGVSVTVKDHSTHNGKAWSQISSDDTTTPIGWVFTDYLSCPAS